MRVIQIGTGSFGKTWRKGIKAFDDLEVAGLVDINPEALKETASFFGVSDDNCFSDPYINWQEKLQADFIIDSTPHHFHYRNAIKALRAGMNVIVVKPMADKYEDAGMMVKEAEKNGRKLVVAQQIRFFEPCLKLKELIQQGEIGEVAYAGVDAFFGRQGPVREKWYQPYPMVVEVAIHHFDLIRWILGQDPVAVMADIWNMPWNDEAWGKKSVCALFKMVNGAHVNFRGLSTAQKGESYPGIWVIEGTKGILRLQGSEIWLNDEKVWPENDTAKAALNLEDLNAEVLRQAIGYFASSSEISISGKDNLKSLEMAFGAIESFEQKREIYLGREE